MPGPPVGHILISNDIGLGTNELKIKGTYVLAPENKAVTSKYLFVSEEEEKQFFDTHPEYKRNPQFIDLEDGAPVRGVDVPYHIKKQKKMGVFNEGGEIKPTKKPKKTVS